MNNKGAKGRRRRRDEQQRGKGCEGGGGMNNEGCEGTKAEAG